MNLRELWMRAQRWYAGHSPRDQRIILGVGVAIGLSLVYVLVVEPIRDYRRGVAEEVADGRDRLESWAKQLGNGPTLRAERDDLRSRLDEAKKRLLPGTSGTLGAAALQERANALAAEKGITVQSTQVMREEMVDPFRKVTVRLMLSGEVKPFAEFIAGLEYGPLQLMLPFMEVTRRGAVAGGKGPRTLTATVEASGYQVAAEEARVEVPEGEGEGGEGLPAEGAATTTTIEGAPATVPAGDEAASGAPTEAAPTETAPAPAGPAPAPAVPAPAAPAPGQEGPAARALEPPAGAGTPAAPPSAPQGAPSAAAPAPPPAPPPPAPVRPAAPTPTTVPEPPGPTPTTEND